MNAIHCHGVGSLGYVGYVGEVPLDGLAVAHRKRAHMAAEDLPLQHEEPALAIRHVALQDFKSYPGLIVAGPFDRGMTTIVGPNGSGKSALLEGICFALGLTTSSLRAAALADLVCHASTSGNASVTIRFCAAAGLHQLVICRRIINRQRSEWCAQVCHCTAPLRAPAGSRGVCWACAECAVVQPRRDELRALVLRELRLDVDRPERFVVHQSNALAVASKSPLELLHFLESVAGTCHLRRSVEAALVTATGLASGIEAAEARLSSAKVQVRAHSKAMDSFAALEACRATLERAQRAQLGIEASYHRGVLAAAREDLAARRVQKRDSEAELEEASTALATASTEAGEAARRVRAGQAAVSAARKVEARLVESSRKLGLSRKQYASSEKQTSRGLEGLRAEADEVGGAAREAELRQAEAIRELRELRPQLVAAKKSLAEREAALDARGCGEEQRGGRGATKARKVASTDTPNTPGSGPDVLAVRLEAEIRELDSRSAEPKSGAARHQAERARRAADDRSRLEAEAERAASQAAAAEEQAAELEAAVAVAAREEAAAEARRRRAEEGARAESSSMEASQAKLATLQVRDRGLLGISASFTYDGGHFSAARVRSSLRACLDG